ncbi:hypothetical protein [Ectobacillus ponti]|uniref:Uncharacterized protein n=1 Tax=Ectobacillus ponti TaxID=2961894 RepID=A0AA42BPP0_9BACI|nr:hypothetical protein [Ectobacillus ponti]MCP8968952.1 hypothetical protein [Ectobacillus ponti]
MKHWIKGLALLSVALFIAAIWLLMLYLNSRNEVQQPARPPEAKKEVKGPQQEVKPANEELRRLAVAFSRELYGQNPSPQVLAKYTTAKARALVIPPGDGEGKSEIDRKIVLQDVQVYEGSSSGKAAAVIAAIKRTITVNGVSTASTSYIRLAFVKGSSWQVDGLVLIGEIPAR